jgi:hypothetical protein
MPRQTLEIAQHLEPGYAQAAGVDRLHRAVEALDCSSNFARIEV